MQFRVDTSLLNLVLDLSYAFATGHGHTATTTSMGARASTRFNATTIDLVQPNALLLDFRLQGIPHAWSRECTLWPRVHRDIDWPNPFNDAAHVREDSTGFDARLSTNVVERSFVGTLLELGIGLSHKLEAEGEVSGSWESDGLPREGFPSSSHARPVRAASLPMQLLPHKTNAMLILEEAKYTLSIETRNVGVDGEYTGLVNATVPLADGSAMYLSGSYDASGSYRHSSMDDAIPSTYTLSGKATHGKATHGKATHGLVDEWHLHSHLDLSAPMANSMVHATGRSLSECICDDTCTGRSDADGVCDDGGDGSSYENCQWGTDCSDCGQRCPTSSSPPPPMMPYPHPLTPSSRTPSPPMMPPITGPSSPSSLPSFAATEEAPEIPGPLHFDFTLTRTQISDVLDSFSDVLSTSSDVFGPVPYEDELHSLRYDSISFGTEFDTLAVNVDAAFQRGNITLTALGEYASVPPAQFRFSTG